MKKVDFEHFSRFQTPLNLSSRGDDLYFCLRRADMEDNAYKTDLYRLRGGQIARLTASGDVNGYQLTDAGVVFPALRDKKDREQAEAGRPQTVLYLLPYDGGEAREYLRLNVSAGDLRLISPDRFFLTAADAPVWEKALGDAEGDEAKAAAAVKDEADYRVLEQVPFCMNGGGYADGGRTRLCLYEGGRVTPLTGADGDASILAVSSDGARLLYAFRPCPLGVMATTSRLFLLDTATLKAEDVTVADTAEHYDGAFLADGRVLCAASLQRNHGCNENPGLFILENGAWRTLCANGLHCYYNSVGSDIRAERSIPGDYPEIGGKLYTLDTLDFSGSVVQIDPDAGEVAPVTGAGGSVMEIAPWQGGMAGVAMFGNHGPELYRIGTDGAYEQLTHINDDLSREYAYSAPVPLTFENEKGQTLMGWVIPPVDFDAEKTYPAILDIHGGPKTVYGDVYFHEMQLWANMGYFVMFCNPTGSDGRGDDFADITGKYGDIDYRDIMAFVEKALSAYPRIDRARVGVTGGSYGGFMTNWIIGHTDFFRAAASQRSISNWLSFYGVSDIGFCFAQDQTAGDVWKNMEKMWAQSPLKYADRVKTPTLFIHSDEDYRCPLEQGLQMYSALKAHGVEARLCMFRGENHELSRSGKPKHRVRRLREITDWFEKYLK